MSHKSEGRTQGEEYEDPQLAEIFLNKEHPIDSLDWTEKILILFLNTRKINVMVMSHETAVPKYISCVFLRE